MNLKEMAEFSIDALWHQKLRSFLTVLGIIVGISSIVLLVGLIQGLKEDVLAQLETFGPRTIAIIPVNPEGGAPVIGPEAAYIPTTGKLFEKDYERVKRLPEIKTITKILIRRAAIIFKDEIAEVTVFGIEADAFRDTMEVEVESGRFLEESDVSAAVVGSDVAELFDEEIKTQSVIYLGDRKFRVVGVMKPTGSTFVPVDDAIAIPFTEAKDIFNETLLENEVSGIRITMEEGTDVEAAADEIESIMLASHRVTEEEKDFGVISPTFIGHQFSEVLDLLTVFLGAIASVSLIVGGIGISNTMFMSVMERRREIGTMKAVGASRKVIRNVFLTESGIIGLIGGFMGLVLAAVIGLALVYLVELTFVFDPLVMVGALLFSIVVGTVSGTFPAIEAAKVDPVVALRYE